MKALETIMRQELLLGLFRNPLHGRVKSRQGAPLQSRVRGAPLQEPSQVAPLEGPLKELILSVL